MIEPKQYRRVDSVVEAFQWTSAFVAEDIVEWADSAAVFYDEELGGPLDSTGEDWGLFRVSGTVVPPYSWVVKINEAFYVYDTESFDKAFVEEAS